MAAQQRATLRQQRFAHALFSEPSASAAYRKAYPSSHRWTALSVAIAAWKLRRNAKVLLITDRIERRMEAVTVEQISAELDEARALAQRLEQPAPMVQASLGKAKLHRLIDAPGSTTLNISVTTIAVAPDLARIRGLVDAAHTTTSGAEPPLIEHAAVRSELSD